MINTDFLGNEVKKGEVVAVLHRKFRGRDTLREAVIIDCTPKRIIAIDTTLDVTYRLRPSEVVKIWR